MRKAIIILMVAATAFIAACERQEDRPVVQPGAVPALSLDKEIQVLRDVVKENPNNLQAWITLGNHLMDTQRFTEATEAYGKALELDPTNVNVRVDRGTCFRNIGRPDMAVQEYRKALETDPNHAFAHRNLGVVLSYDLKDYKGGIEEFERYLEVGPAAPDAADIRRRIEELKTLAASAGAGAGR